MIVKLFQSLSISWRKGILEQVLTTNPLGTDTKLLLQLTCNSIAQDKPRPIAQLVELQT